MHDLRHAFRQLLKSPGFTAIAAVTLALGIGLNTSMFSLMNLLLLQPVPFPDRDHLFRIYRTTPQSQSADHTASDYLALTHVSDEVTEFAACRMWSFTLTNGDRPPVNLNAMRVSGRFFTVLGQSPALGRYFTPEDDQPGNHVVVLSHATWQAQFGGDPAIVGRTVRIDGEPTTVIGVTPASFSSVFLWGTPADAIRPLALTPAEKLDHLDAGVRIVARTRPDVDAAQLNSRLGALATQLAANRPKENQQDGLRAVTLQSTTRSPGSVGISWLMVGLAGFVLLIACANLANLLLARAVARVPEFAVRSALGASRLRLLLPLVWESLLLSLAGGLLGILIASWANDWISSRLSANGVVVFALVMDWRVLAFATVLSTATGLVFGLVPAWLVSRLHVNETLKSQMRGHTGDRAQHRFRHSLIVAQFALALVLLATAGLFIRGLDRLLARDPGWDHHSLLQAVVSLPTTRYTTPAQNIAFYDRLQERVAALPGVERVAIGWTLPIFQFLTQRNYVVEGRDVPPAGREPRADVNGVTPSYLPTLKIPLLAGRNFVAADDLQARPVVMINQSMANALFPHESPLGHRIGGLDASHREWAEIVGVFPDIGQAISVGLPRARFQVLRPLAQEPWGYVTIAVRGPSAGLLADPFRRAVAELDPVLALQQFGTVDELVRIGMGNFVTVNTILVAFAVLGLFLAALGLYGVTARLVVQRTSEIGVRIALGAQPGDVVWLILRSGLRLTLLGSVLGLLGGFGVARLLGSILPGLPLQDPLVIAAVTLLLVVVAFFASWLPARRATRVNPIEALRAE